MVAKAITSHTVTIMDGVVHYLQRKGLDATSPTLVLLHGFPECAHAWLPVVAELPDEFNVILPDLPGFGESSPPPTERDYQVARLAARLASFLNSISDVPIHLVGHDWGGAIAWPLAAFYPQQVATLSIINAAHPSTFVRELKYNPRQREKSIYINTLNKPGAAQDLARRDFRLLQRIMGHSLTLSGDDYARRVTTNWQDTNRLNAMLGYYRNMPQGTPCSDREADAIVIPELRLSQPVSVLWGCQDEAFDQAVLEGLDEWVNNLTIVRRAEATHWLHREQPHWVAKQLADHVSTNL